MRPEVELLILPYASAEGGSLLELLIGEFESDTWAEFWGAVGFVKQSGNFPDLLDAMRRFASTDASRKLRVTFGADVFPGGSKGSDLAAVEAILDVLDELENADVYLYHEKGRTFHPKLYMFANEEMTGALVILGSSNWSEGGLVQNIEANVVMRLDLGEGDQREAFEQVRRLFQRYWTENDAE